MNVTIDFKNMGGKRNNYLWPIWEVFPNFGEPSFGRYKDEIKESKMRPEVFHPHIENRILSKFLGDKGWSS